MTGAVIEGGPDQLDEGVGSERAEFLNDVRSACERLMQDWVAAERLLDAGSGSLAEAAARHRAATRQFLDAQRALLARRAQLDADVAETDRTAREHAASTVADARRRAGLPALAEKFPNGAGGIDALTIEWFDAEPSLRAVLDEWWRADGVECDAVMADATERASVVRQLARIEAGEIMTNWSVPSTLPAPSPDFMSSALLPPTLLTALERTDDLEVDGVCDELLVLLGGAPADGEAAPAEATRCLPPPSGHPVAPLVPLAPPAGPDRSVHAEPVEIDQLTFVEPVGPDDFERFWQHPDRQHGSSSRFVRQLILSMMATTAGLAIVLAWIG